MDQLSGARSVLLNHIYAMLGKYQSILPHRMRVILDLHSIMLILQQTEGLDMIGRLVVMVQHI